MGCQFPRVFRLRQSFPAPVVSHPAAAVRRGLEQLNLRAAVTPGQSVAVTAGSRGVAHYSAILRAVVDYLHDLGAAPFIVPAMGSHGGATVEGQRAVLESYGISEQTMGCPIRAGLETVLVGHSREGIPLRIDRLAWQADHLLVVNRVKPHTWFSGPVESGLMKMLLVGLGKAEGARTFHRAVVEYGFQRVVESAGSELLARCRVLAGVAVVENAYQQVALVEALRPQDFLRREAELLRLARQWMARLPFREIDVLLIDRMGKDISGAGFDANVVGRKFNEHQAMPDEWPKVRRIAVRALTEKSHGNAIGIGLAEFCRSDLLEQMDRHATRVNALISGHIPAGMLPLDFPTDREMLAAALDAIGLAPPEQARLMWIANTLSLEEVECSEIWLDEARARADLEILTPPRALPFDAAGNLPWMDQLEGISLGSKT